MRLPFLLKGVFGPLPEGPRRPTRKQWIGLHWELWKEDVGPSTGRSIKQLLLGVFWPWQHLILGILLGGLGLYALLEGSDARVPPALIWTAIGVALVVGIFSEYHRVRRERERLAEDRKAKVNKQLTEGIELQKRLRKKDFREEENPALQVIAWVHITDLTIQRYTPGYYGQWERDAIGDDRKTPAAQFVDGISTLSEICRKVGLP